VYNKREGKLQRERETGREGGEREGEREGGERGPRTCYILHYEEKENTSKQRKTNSKEKVRERSCWLFISLYVTPLFQSILPRLLL